MFEVDWLCDVAVCVVRVGLQDVFIGFRCRENNDRNFFDAWICFDLSQKLATIFSRKIQIEQNEIRPGAFVYGLSRCRKAVAATPSLTT